MRFIFSKVYSNVNDDANDSYRFLKTNLLICTKYWLKIFKMKSIFQSLPTISVVYWSANENRIESLVYQRQFSVSISWLFWVFNLTPLFLIVTDKFWKYSIK